MNNSLKLLFSTFLFCLLVSSFTQAKEAEMSPAAQEYQRKVDATTAAGIVFKLHYQFGAHGVWNIQNSGDITEETPQLFAQSMQKLAQDLEAFSDTDYGKQLRNEATKLIDFYTKAVVLTLKEEDREKAEEFLRTEGIDPEDEQLLITIVTVMSNRLANFAQLAEVPEWVYTTQADEMPNNLEAED